MIVALAMAIEAPPAAFDREPIVPYAVHYVAPAVIEVRCRTLEVMVARLRNPLAHALGCTDLRTFDIWIDVTLPPDIEAKVLRHEKAHVNGWRH